MDTRQLLVLFVAIVLAKCDEKEVGKKARPKKMTKAAVLIRRNFINACCGKIMCPNMTVATMAPLNETGGGGLKGMRQPKVVVVVVNKAPPPGFFNSFFTTGNEFMTPMTTTAPATTTAPVTTTTPATTTAPVTTTTPATTTAPVTTTATETTSSPLTTEVTRNEPAITAADAADDNRILYNCSADKSWSNAAADCCKRNMTLFAIESAEEQNCVWTTIIRRDFGKYWNEGAGKYWTAGRKASATGKYKWRLPQGASEVQSSPSVQIANYETPSQEKHCLEVHIKELSAPYSAVLSNEDCEIKRKFICEAPLEKPVPFPQCPDKAKCIADPEKKAHADNIITKMEEDGSDTHEAPNGGPLFFESCNTQYMVRFEEHTFESGMNACCKYGYEMVSVDSDAEMKCIHKFYEDISDGLFWTSGTNLGPLSEDNHSWCGSKQPLNYSLWDLNQPQWFWSERCVALKMNKTSSVLHDFPCDYKLHLFCEQPKVV